MESLLEIRDAAETVASAATQTLSTTSALLLTGTATPQQVQAIVTALTGYQGDIRGIRLLLDGEDMADWARYDAAYTTIRLWQWERGLRKALGGLTSQIQATITAARQVLLGTSRNVHLVRSGETLQSLAARYLGDWKEWARIAEANNLTPGALTPGALLVIPPK